MYESETVGANNVHQLQKTENMIPQKYIPSATSKIGTANVEGLTSETSQTETGTESPFSYAESLLKIKRDIDNVTKIDEHTTGETLVKNNVSDEEQSEIDFSFYSGESTGTQIQTTEKKKNTNITVDAVLKSESGCNGSQSNTNGSLDISMKEGDVNVSVDISNEERSAAVNHPQSPLNFNSPLMALDYRGEFHTSENHYTKGCKWSPDGSCLLVASSDSKVRILNLPTPIVQGSFPSERWFSIEGELWGRAAVTVRERELIYDYAWYPDMRSDEPRSCCFAVTCRDQPVHLWDAWNGELVCSYYAYDHLDEMVAAHSANFNLDGTQLVCGFKKCIRVFHTNRPGRISSKIEAKDQPGIISCVAFNPQLPSVMVAGSYLGSIGLYNTRKNNLFMRIDGCTSGVTQVKFSADGTKLFSGMRKSNEILCWDIRNPGTLLCGFKREVATNQRIYFDLDQQHNRHLVAGDTSGRVSEWDLSVCCREKEGGVEGDAPSLTPTSTFTAHMDCTNGVSLHPYYPILATSSGQRHFPEPASCDDSSSENGDNGPLSLFTPPTTTQENTVKLWWLG